MQGMERAGLYHAVFVIRPDKYIGVMLRQVHHRPG